MYSDVKKENLRHVGRDITRIDASEKLTGQALYTGDLDFKGMLHAKVLRSPHASAEIIKIDTSKAEQYPGVRAVLTGAELDYRLGLYLVDKHILAKDEVRHYGEAVAAVAADTLSAAADAVRLIEVEYKVKKPVTDPVTALEIDSPLVHPNLGSYNFVEAAFTPVPGTNIANHTKLRKGNIDKGFEEADFVIEREYTNPNVQHVPMETHVAVGQWGVNDRISIWTSAQSAFTVRNLFCHSLGISHSKVRVNIPYVGGGFGGKAGIGLEPLVCLLSKKAGGSFVKLQATREEEFSLLACRSGLVYRIKTGVKRDGKITAQKMTMYWDAGAYADYAVNVTRASGYSAAGPYEIPNAWLDAYTVYTNKPFGTAYRGFGHVEFSWGLERHLDLVAETAGLDPLDFRLINAVRPGSKTLTGEVITEHTGNVVKCMESVAKEINYRRKTPEETEFEKKSGMIIAKSVVALHKAPAMPPFTATAAVLKMNEDGSVILNHSLTEIGMGTYTSLVQIVAEELKFPIEKIKMAFEIDTDRDPYDWQTVASKGLLMSGNACILAARDLKKKAYKVAAQILRAQLCDLDNDGDGVFVKHNPEKRINFKEFAVGYSYPDGNGIGGPIIGVGKYMAQGLSNLDKETGQGHPALDWTYGAHGMITAVDPETGEYEIMHLASCFDVGRAINPGAVRGQSIGGAVQGLGTAMCEGYIYSDDGKLLNPSFTDNKILTARDVPKKMTCMVVETPQIDGPFGARGVGEHSMIAICGALGNTVKRAVGADLTHMPVRAEDVWWALQDEETRKRAPYPSKPVVFHK
jgi:CO/xanthine dehydrogenase Mo-binding subunit